MSNTNGDYISRVEAIALAMQYCPDDDGSCPKAGHDLRELLDDLENAPPADVRPVVRGHWIGAYNDLKCSVCGKNWDELRTADGEDWGYWEDIPPYCPNCGAKMRDDSDAIAKD